ncbi:primosome PriB/single-strand DNA-binding protein [Artemisia annua]|uniref:Primosome PriB/single-strand DNA-binding protein n=1 Tax=Artemisia annua TaxID=35608 RepID=A0A2U1P6A9_ARTAN|nr:primosome PriB/single-strand DNA-binding protein [Artemisia annua]
MGYHKNLNSMLTHEILLPTTLVDLSCDSICDEHTQPFFLCVLLNMWDDMAELSTQHIKPNDYIYVSGYLRSFGKASDNGNFILKNKVIVQELNFVANNGTKNENIEARALSSTKDLACHFDLEDMYSKWLKKNAETYSVGFEKILNEKYLGYEDEDSSEGASSCVSPVEETRCVTSKSKCQGKSLGEDKARATAKRKCEICITNYACPCDRLAAEIAKQKCQQMVKAEALEKAKRGF